MQKLSLFTVALVASFGLSGCLSESDITPSQDAKLSEEDDTYQVSLDQWGVFRVSSCIIEGGICFNVGTSGIHGFKEDASIAEANATLTWEADIEITQRLTLNVFIENHDDWTTQKIDTITDTTPIHWARSDLHEFSTGKDYLVFQILYDPIVEDPIHIEAAAVNQWYEITAEATYISG